MRALHHASQWCERSDNHDDLARLLSQPRYVGAPAESLVRGLSNHLRFAADDAPRLTKNFYVTARYAAGFPWRSHALWFYSQMVRWGQIRFAAEHVATALGVYRPDVYRSAREPLSANLPLADVKGGRRTRQCRLDRRVAGRPRLRA